MPGCSHIHVVGFILLDVFWLVGCFVFVKPVLCAGSWRKDHAGQSFSNTVPRQDYFDSLCVEIGQDFSPLRFTLFIIRRIARKTLSYTGMSLTTWYSVFLENVPELHQNILLSKIKDLEVSDGKSVAPTCLFWHHFCHQLISPQCLRLHKYSNSVSAEHHCTQRLLEQDRSLCQSP